MSKKLGAEVWYLFNSGFAVKIGGRFLIFDYFSLSPFKKRRGLEAGTIDPAELKGCNVTVFASHAHMDHYTPSVLKWERELPDIRFVLSCDIDAGSTANVTKAYPDMSCDVGGLKVRTLRSTDEGVAFIVETEGIKIYHAGDLNWWHWEGEPEAENQAMGEAYRTEIDKVRGEMFDLAFVPVDPRLGKEYLWGLDYFMKTADAGVVFPMHFRNTYSVFDRLNKDPAAAGYRDRVARISRRGERFEL
jgi:L-ascorbate metabolism protein UlaG (beta-lactamase superfamily)